MKKRVEEELGFTVSDTEYENALEQAKRKLLIEKGYPEDWDTVFFDQELWAIERAIEALKRQA